MGAGLTTWQAEARPREAVAKDARLRATAGAPAFIADLSKKVDVNVFSLADPYRVIVDLPEVSFQMPEGLGKEKRGLVTGYRYGLFAPGKSRIVIDMSGPFLVDKAFVLDARDDQPARLVVDLVPTDEQDFPRQAQRGEVPAAAGAAPSALKQAQSRTGRRGSPWWSFDPGHGGVDPGTSSADGITEKEVVLAFAQRSQGEARGRRALRGLSDP